MQEAPGSKGEINSAVARHRPDLNVTGSGYFRVFRAAPDLINGNPTDFRFIFVSEGLETQWRWMKDAWMIALGRNATEDELKLATVREAALQSVLLTSAGMTTAKADISALLLAAARQAIRRAWGIAEADIVATQLASIHPDPVIADDNTIATDHAVLGPIADWARVVTRIGALYDALADTYVAQAAQAAIGMPPCNGATIVLSLVHHYVAPHKQICDAILDQVFPKPLTAPTDLTTDDLKDILCHKAAHPILSTLLVWMARSKEVKTRLNKIGLGSASVRLPAEFGPEKTASAFHALVHRGKAASADGNVAVDTTPVDTLKAAVVKAISDDRTYAGVEKATELANDFKSAFGYGISWLAGFLTAQFDETKASGLSKSVVDAHSVKNLIQEFQDAFATGSEHYQLLMKWKKTQARAGKLAGYGLFGAETPKPFGDPDEPESN